MTSDQNQKPISSPEDWREVLPEGTPLPIDLVEDLTKLRDEARDVRYKIMADIGIMLFWTNVGIERVASLITLAEEETSDAG